MKSLTIYYPEEKTAIVGPVPRSRLSVLEPLLLEIQAYWIEDDFSTGDTVARDRCWDLMQQVSALLPRLDSFAGKMGFDLEPLEADYEQLEKLFFAQSVAIADGEIELDAVQPSLIYALHRYNPKKKLIDAERLRQSLPAIALTVPSPPQTSPSKPAETLTPIISPTLQPDLELTERSPSGSDSTPDS